VYILQQEQRLAIPEESLPIPFLNALRLVCATLGVLQEGGGISQLPLSLVRLTIRHAGRGELFQRM